MYKTWKLLFICALVFLASCSPKVVKKVNKPVQQPPVLPVKIEKKPVKKFTQAEISLLIPFKLNQINLQTATKAQLDRTDMAIDFYQGIKLGLDSATSLGLDFKLNVLDSRDNNEQLEALIKKNVLKNSNLIIGPVFPDGVKYISNYAIANDLAVVSPLAASKPSEFNNPKLISIVNDIDQHGYRIADYIASHYQSTNTIVVLINTKKSAEEQLAAPIRLRFKEKFPNFIVQEFISSYAFETRMVKDKNYVVILSSSESSFVKPTLQKLYNLSMLKSGGYNINLFGHPNWIKQNFNNTQLQRLNTIIGTSYYVDYKSSAVISFIKKYRNRFKYEPSEYSFKGFDIGFYFGRLLARHGEQYLDYLLKENYKGLHNSFEFSFSPQYGYYNTELVMLQYRSSGLFRIN